MTDPVIRGDGPLIDKKVPSRPKLGRILLVPVLALAAAAIWSATSPDETAAPTTLIPLPTLPEAAPNTVGMMIHEARQTLGDRQIQEIWSPHEAPEGTVLNQLPPPSGTGLIQLAVSSGGPVATLSELPDYLVWVAESFAPNEESFTVHLTKSGPAFKTDQLLFGECPAVELASEISLDPEFELYCIEPPRMGVRGSLPDGTGYLITGIPSLDKRLFQPFGLVMLDVEGEPAIVVGETRWAKAATDAPSVTWEPPYLTVFTGTWLIAVEATEESLSLLPTEVENLGDFVNAREEFGHPILDLTPPLRFQRPEDGLGPLTISYNPYYSRLTVSRGCSEDTTLCSEDGSIGVQDFAYWTDPTEATLTQIGPPTDGWPTVLAPDESWMISYPPDWYWAEEDLMPALGWPGLFALGTMRLHPNSADSSCAQEPTAAISDIDSNDVIIWATGPGPDFWSTTGVDILREDHGDTAECSGRDDLEVWNLRFSEPPTLVQVVFGPEIEVGTRQETWRIISTLLTDADHAGH